MSQKHCYARESQSTQTPNPIPSKKDNSSSVIDFNVFLVGLSRDIKPSDLKAFFSPHYRSLREVKIRRRQRKTGKVSGFATLYFSDPSEAEAVISQQYHYLKNRRLIAKPYLKGSELQNFREDVSRRRLFVSGMPLSYSDSNFSDILSRFGKVEQAFIVKGPSDTREGYREGGGGEKGGKSRGFGYVTFCCPAAARKAMRAGRLNLGMGVVLKFSRTKKGDKSLKDGHFMRRNHYFYESYEPVQYVKKNQKIAESQAQGTKAVKIDSQESIPSTDQKSESPETSKFEETLLTQKTEKKPRIEEYGESRDRNSQKPPKDQKDSSKVVTKSIMRPRMSRPPRSRLDEQRGVNPVESEARKEDGSQAALNQKKGKKVQQKEKISPAGQPTKISHIEKDFHRGKVRGGELKQSHKQKNEIITSKVYPSSKNSNYINQGKFEILRGQNVSSNFFGIFGELESQRQEVVWRDSRYYQHPGRVYEPDIGYSYDCFGDNSENEDENWRLKQQQTKRRYDNFFYRDEFQEEFYSLDRKSHLRPSNENFGWEERLAELAWSSRQELEPDNLINSLRWYEGGRDGEEFRGIWSQRRLTKDRRLRQRHHQDRPKGEPLIPDSRDQVCNRDFFGDNTEYSYPPVSPSSKGAFYQHDQYELMCHHYYALSGCYEGDNQEDDDNYSSEVLHERWSPGQSSECRQPPHLDYQNVEKIQPINTQPRRY